MTIPFHDTPFIEAVGWLVRQPQMPDQVIGVVRSKFGLTAGEAAKAITTVRMFNRLLVSKQAVTR